MKPKWAGSPVESPGITIERTRMLVVADLAQASDESLMKATGGGDTCAFVILIERYQAELFRYCMHFLKDPEWARDASQDVLLRLCCNSHTFDTRQCFKVWFLRIARNVCLTLLHRQKRVVVTSLHDALHRTRGEDGALWKSDSPDPSEILLQDERFHMLLEAVHRLPIHTRQIVDLRYFQQLSFREIAALTGDTEGGLRTRLHRALKRLRCELKEYIEDI